jgi:hypothetical protein
MLVPFDGSTLFLISIIHIRMLSRSSLNTSPRDVMADPHVPADRPAYSGNAVVCDHESAMRMSPHLDWPSYAVYCGSKASLHPRNFRSGC